MFYTRFYFLSKPTYTNFFQGYKEIRQNIRKFIWQSKKVRIKAKYLQDKKENVSFTLPNDFFIPSVFFNMAYGLDNFK